VLYRIAIGTRNVSWQEIFGALQGQMTHHGPKHRPLMRIPRTVLAVIAGSALGVIWRQIMPKRDSHPLWRSRPFWVSMLAPLSFVVHRLALVFGINQPYKAMVVDRHFGGSINPAIFCVLSSVQWAYGNQDTGSNSRLAGARHVRQALSSFTARWYYPETTCGRGEFWQIGGVGAATFDRHTACSALSYPLAFLLSAFVAKESSTRWRWRRHCRRD